MIKRTPIVAGNWKMNGTRDSCASLVDSVSAGVGTVTGVDIALFPPFLYIPLVARHLGSGSRIALGGQNLDPHPGGAYTGEVSGPMLKDYGCSHVIIGHSERRALFGETDAMVADKFAAAQQAGLIPILCIGETLAERESGTTEAVVGRQVDAVMASVGARALTEAVIAYEPVWAIGTGKTATPQQAQEVHAFIRARVAAKDASVAAGVRILYGGSVKGSNAKELFSQTDIDGGLIGGASLDPTEFLTIIRAAA